MSQCKWAGHKSAVFVCKHSIIIVCDRFFAIDLTPFSVSTPQPRVAILVDGDNVPHRALPQIETDAQKLGDVVARRVYADMALRRDWAAETSYSATHATSCAGKNRADTHLVIDAIDLAHRGLVTSFLIVSDDRDFDALIAYLQVNRFAARRIGKARPEVNPAKVPLPQPVATRISSLDATLQDRIRSCADAKTGVAMNVIGNLMKGATVKVQTGMPTWHAYLKSRPDLYVLEGPATARRVRLKA